MVEEEQEEEEELEWRVFQSSGTAYIPYKRDKKGNQSIFNFSVSPEKDADEEKKLILVIDNAQFKKDSWFGNVDLKIGDVYKEFGEWSEGAPLDFILAGNKNIGHLARTELKTKDTTRETKAGVKAKIPFTPIELEASHTKKSTTKKKSSP